MSEEGTEETQEDALLVPSGERAQLQETATRLGRWQGSVDRQLSEHAEHLSRINGSMEKMASRMGSIDTTLARMDQGGSVTAQRLEAKVDALISEKTARQSRIRDAMIGAGFAGVVGVIVFLVQRGLVT